MNFFLILRKFFLLILFINKLMINIKNKKKYKFINILNNKNFKYNNLI